MNLPSRTQILEISWTEAWTIFTGAEEEWGGVSDGYTPPLIHTCTMYIVITDNRFNFKK